MDRRRRRPRLLALAVTATAGAALAADAGPPLRAMAWVPPGTDPVAVFASEPAECLRTPTDAVAAQSVPGERTAPHIIGGHLQVLESAF